MRSCNFLAAALALVLAFGLSPSAPACTCGDANDDGYVNTSDVTFILQVTIGLETLAPDAVHCADVDGSGVVTSSDALLLARYLVGLDALACNKALVLYEECADTFTFCKLARDQMASALVGMGIATEVATELPAAVNHYCCIVDLRFTTPIPQAEFASWGAFLALNRGGAWFLAGDLGSDSTRGESIAALLNAEGASEFAVSRSAPIDRQSESSIILAPPSSGGTLPTSNAAWHITNVGPGATWCVATPTGRTTGVIFAPGTLGGPHRPAVLVTFIANRCLAAVAGDCPPTMQVVSAVLAYLVQIN